MQKTIETHIKSVTVYRDRALVTRRGKIELTGEETELLIPNLPLSLEPDSVRLTGRGTVAVRILGVRTEEHFTPVPTQNRIRQLEEQIGDLERQEQNYTDQLKSLYLQHEFIQTLSKKSAERFSLSLAKQEVSLTETAALLEFIHERHTQNAIAESELEQQRHQIKKELQFLRSQLQQAQNPPRDSSYSLIITLAPEAPGEFELDAVYLTNGVRWTPLYDLHFSSSSEVVNLSYLAEVQQRTGEDWSGVELTLSTAKPELGSLPPKLRPWYIDVATRPVAATKRQEISFSRGSALENDFNELEEILEKKAPYESSVDVSSVISAETVTSQVEKTGSVVTFSVPGNSTILSEETPHKVTVFQEDYSISLQYVAIPKLVSFAYLQVAITNPITGVTFLPGQANIFRDNAFVGKTTLNNIAPGQEFEVNLGIDEGLKLERDLVERQVDRKLIGQQRRITYAYRIVAENLLDETVTLKLTEQLPVSRNEKLKVRLTQVSPEIELGEMGRLAWTLNLSPHSQLDVYYQFVVEHPPDAEIVGLEVDQK